ncbi:hypothetical protein [Streptomyces sp. NPDC014623]|uniref:hypothetical protein n=1 Tax=Streptomyces sp. NPDC014623 TaxID=3364875 RepID=UPI003701259A
MVRALPHPRGTLPVHPGLLVALLVVVVTVQTGLLAHRHPRSIQPLALAVAGIAVMVAVVMPIAAR